ncbi:MAG: hypothetical protein ACSHXD_03915 [Marinosulfonomonas sp.]
MWRLTVILLVVPSLSFAGGFKPRDKAADAQPPRVIEYYCRDSNGNRQELGTVICVTASCMTWMARCDKSLNVTTWRKIQDGCPAVGLMDRLKAVAPLMSVPIETG